MNDNDAPETTRPEYPGLISIARLAEWLGVSDHAVKKWVQAGPTSKKIPPYFRINGQVRFDPADVQDWLDKKAVR
ncbi:helix-turn-helix domain-containing protein [Nocardioides cavernae]|uniref:Helix-turn-helix domain-containing protein n=1 Tax=Nocardioides cavernae TaxID=1921566 RepID=A0ABR8N9N5_9ACTN|nr:helix-turn-helix domain-containing protein [Nocardioides cavernae]MBD3924316.1 helix-turn-helix domain-containing protein [Nocardioides cavernae]MBM7510741.1 putative DNA-binding transcriptional regulator AlpA [Nocardioides cavernae]